MCSLDTVFNQHLWSRKSVIMVKIAEVNLQGILRLNLKNASFIW